MERTSPKYQWERSLFDLKTKCLSQRCNAGVAQDSVLFLQCGTVHPWLSSHCQSL